MATKAKREYTSLNYQGVDLYTGKVFYSQKLTALYEPGTNHRADIASHGSIINPRIPNRFGQFFDADDLLESHSEFSLPDEAGWHKPVAYSVLYHSCDYKGPLPKEGEILVVASNLIKRAEHQRGWQEVHYQFKHIERLTPLERRLTSEPLVEADYKSDYMDEERCPEEPPLPSYREKLQVLYGLQEYWEYLSRLEEAGELDIESKQNRDDQNEEDDNEEERDVNE